MSAPPVTTTTIQPHRDLAFISHNFTVNAMAMSILLRQIGSDAYSLYWAVLLEIIEANQPVVELPNRKLEQITRLGTHEVRAAQEVLAEIGAFRLHRGQSNARKQKRQPNRYELNPDFTLTVPSGPVPQAIIGGDEDEESSPTQSELQNAVMFAEQFNLPLETVLAQAKAWLNRSGVTTAVVDEALAKTVGARYNADGETTGVSKPFAYVEAVIDDILQPTDTPPAKKKRKPKPETLDTEPPPPSQSEVEAAFEARMATELSEDEKIWTAALESLKNQTGAATYSSVFENSTMRRIDDNIVEITPATDKSAEWMKQKWLDKIAKTLSVVMARDMSAPPVIIKINYPQRE
jgi:hypothetical protein